MRWHNGTLAFPMRNASHFGLACYAGEADPAFSQARSACERIPNARSFSLPGLTHMQAFYESGKVVPPVLEFLDAAG
jgi:hypothetical protein